MNKASVAACAGGFATAVALVIACTGALHVYRSRAHDSLAVTPSTFLVADYLADSLFPACYRAVTSDRAKTERSALAAAISQAPVPRDEKAFLLLRLLDLSAPLHECELIAGGGRPAYNEWLTGFVGQKFFDSGITLYYDLRNGRPYAADISLLKCRAFPLGFPATSETVIPFAPQPPTDEAALLLDDYAKSKSLSWQTDPAPFVRLFERVRVCETDRDAPAVAAAIRESTLSDMDKDFLLFKLLRPGMDLALAHDIWGGAQSLVGEGRSEPLDSALAECLLGEDRSRPMRSRSYSCGVRLHHDDSDAPAIAYARLALGIQSTGLYLRLADPADASYDSEAPVEPAPSGPPLESSVSDYDIEQAVLVRDEALAPQETRALSAIRVMMMTGGRFPATKLGMFGVLAPGDRWRLHIFLFDRRGATLLCKGWLAVEDLSVALEDASGQEAAVESTGPATVLYHPALSSEEAAPAGPGAQEKRASAAVARALVAHGWIEGPENCVCVWLDGRSRGRFPFRILHVFPNGLFLSQTGRVTRNGRTVTVDPEEPDSNVGVPIEGWTSN